MSLFFPEERSRMMIAKGGASLLAVAVACFGAADGVVYDKGGSPLDGVVVKSGTDSVRSVDGRWSIGETVSATRAGSWAAPTGTRHLVLESGRLRVALGGRDAAGKISAATCASRASQAPREAFRAAVATGDTLRFLYAGRLLGTRILGKECSRLIEVVDTSEDRTHGIPWVEGIRYDSIQDARDGQVYRVVPVGRQLWMAENLDFATDSSVVYEGNGRNGALYGRLYSWADALDLPDSCNWNACALPTHPRGACPAGWHVPDTTEWRELEDTVAAATGVGLDGIARMLESRGGWFDADGVAHPGLDSVGMRILPSGNRYDDGVFNHIRERTFLHSATQNDASTAWARQITLDWTGVVGDYYYGKGHMLAVRCVADSLVR